MKRTNNKWFSRFSVIFLLVNEFSHHPNRAKIQENQEKQHYRHLRKPSILESTLLWNMPLYFYFFFIFFKKKIPALSPFDKKNYFSYFVFKSEENSPIIIFTFTDKNKKYKQTSLRKRQHRFKSIETNVTNAL